MTKRCVFARRGIPRGVVRGAMIGLLAFSALGLRAWGDPGAQNGAAVVTLPDDPKARGAMMNAAVDHDNVAKVKAMIALDPTVVNDLGPGGHSPLVSALVDSSKDITPLLLAAGADVNLPNGQGILPLNAAVGSGQTDLVQMILDKGAHVDAADSSGAPPIFAAINEDNLDIVKLLVAKGAKLTVTDGSGNTPMAAAMAAQAPAAGDIVQFLLGQGAALPGANDGGRSLVDSALNQYGSQDTLEIVLTQLKNINMLGSEGFALLHKAVELDNQDAARQLLDHGANVDVRAADGSTPLLLAVERGNRSMAQLLLDHKADPNARDDRGENGLTLLLRGAAIPTEIGDRNGEDHNFDRDADTGTAEMVSLLLDHGIHTDVPDQFGLTALQYALLTRSKVALALLPPTAASPFLRLLVAIAKDNAAQMTALLRAHPDFAYTRLPTGMTALHVAALWDAKASAAILIQLGAEVNARDAYAQTPLALASSVSGNSSMVNFLLAHGASVAARDYRDATPLHLAVMAGDPVMVADLIHAKADVNARSRAMGPPLNYVNGGSIEIATALLDAGADPNAGMNGQEKPLISAIDSNNLPLVKLLIAKGCDVNAHETNSYTPLMHAIDRRADDIARVLIDNGADISANVNGQSVLQNANNMGDTPISDLIKSKLANMTTGK